jgi:protoporphyrinogen oxidase
LSRRGFAVVVFEREKHAGGRARSETVDGFTLEAMGALFSTGDRGLLAWIDATGARDDLLPLRPVVSLRSARGRTSIVDSRGVVGVGRIPGVKSLEAMRLVRLPRLLRRYGDRLAYSRPEDGADLDDRCIGDFGRLYFGRSVLTHWMQPFVNATCPGDPDDQSRVLFLRRLRACGDGRLGLLRGGVGEIAETAAAKLNVSFGTGVESIAPAAGGGWNVDAPSAKNRREATFDAVVIATNAADAARIAAPGLATAEREGLAMVRYQLEIRLAVGLRRPLFSHPQFVQPAPDEDSPLQSVLIEPGSHGGRVPPDRGLAVLAATAAFSESNRETPDETITKELMAAFERIHPSAESAVRFTKLYRIESARPRFAVGRYREIARFERIQRSLRDDGRRLYFAGDYLVDPSLEGAHASGARAAGAVIADFAADRG